MEGSFSTIVLLVNVKALPRQQHPKNFYRAGVDIIRRVHSANFVKNCSSAFVSTAKIKRGVLEQKMGHLKRGPILDDKGKFYMGKENRGDFENEHQKKKTIRPVPLNKTLSLVAVIVSSRFEE